MQRPARRAVSRSEEHLRVHPPTRWLLPSDLLVRGDPLAWGEAIEADHDSPPPPSARAVPRSAIEVQPPPDGPGFPIGQAGLVEMLATGARQPDDLSRSPTSATPAVMS
jgi:hypothetical protein